MKPAFISIYNLTVEYRSPTPPPFQVGYVGESGYHLVTANWKNQLPNPCIIGGVVQTVATANPPAACLTQAPLRSTPRPASAITAQSVTPIRTL